MTRFDALRHLVWFIPLVVAYGVLAHRRRTPQVMAAVLLGAAWNAWAVLAVNLVAIHAGWWVFDPTLVSFMGMPLELWLGWTVLWGAVAPLAFDRPVGVIVVAFAWADVIVMPAISPLVVLHDSWYLGEVLALSVALVPGLLLARWTITHTHLTGRVALQVICAAGLFLWIVPSVALQPGGWDQLLIVYPVGYLGIVAQVLLIPLALGARAAVEFARCGDGTPLPYDPPHNLVVSGPYSYVRNPMQVSMVLLYLIAGIALQSIWLLGAAFVSFLYGAGLASWHEGMEMSSRYAEAWATYRRRVRSWIPSLHPKIDGEATLLVAFSCETCSSIGRWFRAREPIGLRILPAEDSPDPELRRVTYVPSRGPRVRGVAAIARALEHIHLGWAVVGWLLSLPGVAQFAQLLADAFGPPPHSVAGLPYDAKACDVAKAPV